MCPSRLQNCYGAINIHLLPPPPAVIFGKGISIEFILSYFHNWMYEDILGTTSSCKTDFYDKVLDPGPEPDAEVEWYYLGLGRNWMYFECRRQASLRVRGQTLVFFPIGCPMMDASGYSYPCVALFHIRPGTDPVTCVGKWEFHKVIQAEA